MPNVKPVDLTQPSSQTPFRSRRPVVASDQEQTVASPALELQDLLETAMARPKARTSHPGNVAVLAGAVLVVVSVCLAFWVVVVSRVFSAVA